MGFELVIQTEQEKDLSKEMVCEQLLDLSWGSQRVI